MPASIDELAKLQRAVVDRWHEGLPRDGWALSHVVWARVVNSTMREMLLIGESGEERVLPFPEPLAAALEAYREGLAQPGGGGWPIGFELRLSPNGQAGLRVIWNDQVWFGFHPGAPLQPPVDPTSDLVPTPEMWALELKMHPREDDAIPDWWRFLIQHSPQAAPAEHDDLELEPVSRERALEGAPPLPGAMLMMDGAWGWDRLLDEVDEAVRGAIAAAADADLTENLDRVVERAQAALRQRHDSEWLAATPIRLLREWNERHGQRDPDGLGEVDPSASFAEERRRSLSLKRADAALGEVLDDLVAQQVRGRCLRPRG